MNDNGQRDGAKQWNVSLLSAAGGVESSKKCSNMNCPGTPPNVGYSNMEGWNNTPKTNIKNLKNAAEFGTGKHRGFQPLVILKNGDIFFRSANLRAACHMPLRIWEVKCHVSPEIESLKKDRWHWIPPIHFNPLRWNHVYCKTSTLAGSLGNFRYASTMDFLGVQPVICGGL